MRVCGRVSPKHGIVISAEAYVVRRKIVAALVFAVRVQLVVADPEIGPGLAGESLLIDGS